VNLLTKNSDCGDLIALFSLFDSSGDGVITAAEVDDALRAMAGILPADAATALRQRLNGSGSLTQEQFLAWANGQPALEAHHVLRELFSLIDVDDNGWLSPEELAVMVSLLEPDLQGKTYRSSDELLHLLDRDGDGRVSADEFVRLLESKGGLSLSLAYLKRLKKQLVQLRAGTNLARVGLVEVDCDLGAGIPGAGSGIDLLKSAIERNRGLAGISERLIAEINQQQRASNTATAVNNGSLTPHARHIGVIAPVMDQAASLVAATIEEGRFPIVLAGDHSTAAGTIAGIRRAFPRQRLGVIWIDAHADIHSPYTTPSGNMHGMPLAIASAHDNLLEAVNSPDPETLKLWSWLKSLNQQDVPSINLRDLVYIAVRDTEAAEDLTIAANDIPVIRTEDVRRDGPVQSAERALLHLQEVELIYVSFDVDALDATICKGTGTPVPGGLWVDEAQLILSRLLVDPRVCCWEICEINPHLDTLNTLAEVSLGIFQAGVSTLDQRLNGGGDAA
jgi:arginase